MKNRLRLAAASLLAAAMLVLGGCTSNFRFETYENPEKYQTGSFEYEAADVTAIEIDWVAGSIELIHSSEKSLSVSESGEDMPEDKRLRWYIDGTTLHIKYCSSGYIGEIDPLLKRLTVELPAGTALDIDNVSAAISAEKLELSDLELENVSGSIDIGAVSASHAELETISGALIVGDIKIAGDLEIESVSGAVALGGVSAKNLTAGSVSGRMELAVKDCEQINLNGTSAEMRLELLDGLGATLDFTGVSGRLKTDAEYSSDGDRRIFGDGRCAVKVETVSGDLSIIA